MFHARLHCRGWKWVKRCLDFDRKKISKFSLTKISKKQLQYRSSPLYNIQIHPFTLTRSANLISLPTIPTGKAKLNAVERAARYIIIFLFPTSRAEGHSNLQWHPPVHFPLFSCTRKSTFLSLHGPNTTNRPLGFFFPAVSISDISIKQEVKPCSSHVHCCTATIHRHGKSHSMLV